VHCKSCEPCVRFLTSARLKQIQCYDTMICSGFQYTADLGVVVEVLSLQLGLCKLLRRLHRFLKRVQLHSITVCTMSATGRSYSQVHGAPIAVAE
jgi:hypothetical protein